MAGNRLQRARRFMQEGRADLAVEALRKLTRQKSRDADTWKLLGFACHQEQLEPEAANALARAFVIDDRDATTAMALAQSRLLSGLPAVKSFRDVMRLVPDNLDAIRGYADALAAEDQHDAAVSILRDTLKDHPDWLAGHKSLASLCSSGGDTLHFADSYSQACASQPENLTLRLEWFRTVAQTRDWPTATRIIDEGARIFGSHPQLRIARVFIASESGDDELASELFDETRSIDDVVRNMALIRFSLRTGDIDVAESTAMRYVDTRSAAVIWPYLSLIWRLKGDPRAEWLDGSPIFVSSFDLDLHTDELDQLVALLHRLHKARAPYAEQSVRGGTQTDMNLFLRHEPVLRDLSLRIKAAVSRYVEQLPPRVDNHPLLGVERTDLLRGRMLFSGSWSVRLKAKGFNVCHTHPMGLVSSALYVSLPEPTQLGKPPAGWIQFGTPPTELGLSLQPYRQVEPAVGRLVLFPSTMWHSTVPFDDGERLVVAFDVRPPLAPERSDAMRHRG